MKKFFAGIMAGAIFALGAADAFCSGWTEYENSLVKDAMQIRLDYATDREDVDAKVKKYYAKKN